MSEDTMKKARTLGARLGLYIMPLVLGFAGGVLATRVTAPPPVDAQEVQGTVTAREFKLVDSAGRVRAQLTQGGNGDTGQVQLSMFGGVSGRDGARIFVDPQGRGTIVLTQNGGATPSISMGAYSWTNAPRIDVADAEGQVRVVLSGEGTPYINVCPPNADCKPLP
jgi:hypothetical protein